METNYEKFYGKIRKQNESMIITIPSNVIKFADYKEGDEVLIMMKKNDNN